MTTNYHKRNGGRARTSIDCIRTLKGVDSPSNQSQGVPPLQFKDEEGQCSDRKSATSRFTSETPSGRMKLRDYLFMATKRAKKITEDKKEPNKENIDSLRAQEPTMTRRSSKQEIRKLKYGMENSEMFEILR